jgi:hypothetical protein
MKTILLSAILVPLFLTGFGQSKKISKTFNDVKSIEIETASGDLKIKRSADASVKLELVYTYDEDDYKPSFDQSGTRLIVSEKFDRDGNHSGSANWTIEVPDNTSIRFNAGSGDLSIDQLTADVRSNVGSGDITISLLKGTLDLNSGSGDIEVDKMDGEIEVNTGSGNIRIEGATGSLHLNTGSGTIALDNVKGNLSANTGSGDIKAKAVTITGKSKFNTGSGDAAVSLATALEHDISVNSGSGNSTLSFSGKPINGTVIMTANKKHGQIVAPFKFDSEREIEDDNSSTRIQKTAKIGSGNITIKVATGSGTAEIQK